MIAALAAFVASEVLACPQAREAEALPLRLTERYVAELASRDRLSPHQAVIVLARRLDPLAARYGRASEELRADLERIATKVEWPKAEPGDEFVERCERVETLLAKTDFGRSLGVALALVLAAWDLALERRQAVRWVVGMACDDPGATLLAGRRMTSPSDRPFSSYLSPDWPWRLEAGRHRLGSFELVPVPGGDADASVRSFVRTWRSLDRVKGW